MEKDKEKNVKYCPIDGTSINMEEVENDVTYCKGTCGKCKRAVEFADDYETDKENVILIQLV